MSTTEPGEKPPRISQATELVALASARYHVIRDPAGKVYATEQTFTGQRRAVPIDGARSSVRTALAAAYYEATGKTAGRNALTEAIDVLRGHALSEPATPVHLRHGRLDSPTRYVDLGYDGGLVAITDNGWQYVDAASNVVFRQTALSAPMPQPNIDADWRALDLLREVLNVTDTDWPLVVAWMVAVTLGDVAVPIMFLSGEQGCGKTEAARVVVAITDPSTVPVRGAPRDLEGWVVAAAGSRVVALDNVSTISEWLSDALCRAATGEGLVKRQLYTDDELAVLTFRRAVIITTIDAGVLRGDLGERLLPIELERIPDEARRTDLDLAATLDVIGPVVLGGLLDLTARVLDGLTAGVDIDELPRMADFGRVCAAVDAETGWSSLDNYRAAQTSVMREMVTGDLVAGAVAAVARAEGTWKGSPAELLDAIAVHRPDDAKAWPRTPRGLAGQVRRLAPALRSTGIAVDTAKTNGVRLIILDALHRVERDGRAGRSSVAALKETEREEMTCKAPHRPDRPYGPSSASPPSWPCPRCGAGVQTLYGTDEQVCRSCWDELNPRPPSAFNGFLP